MNARKHLAACIGLALLCAALFASTAQADFGLKEFNATATNADGTTDFQAGSHPFEYTVSFTMNQDINEVPEGRLRDVIIDLPPGVVGDPQAIPRCTGAQFEGGFPECPVDTQIGVVKIKIADLGTVEEAVYNLTPPAGVPGSVGFSLIDYNSFQEALVRSDGDYGLSLADNTVPSTVRIQSITEILWGVPADPRHDSKRGRHCLTEGAEPCPVASALPPTAFLTLPTACGEPLQTTFHVDSVENPGVFSTKTATTEEEGIPAGIDGCNQLEFEPTISSQPTTSLADSPSGLDFDLKVPQPAQAEQGAGAIETCETGEWSGEPSEFNYQWLRDGVPIPGAADPTYEVSDADASASLQCEVIATNTGIGPGRAVSSPASIPPLPATPAPTPAKPSIQLSGGPEPTATCAKGVWFGNPSFSYRWFKNGQLVPGETEFQYQAGPTPFTLQCEVTGSNVGGSVVALSANATTTPPLEPALADSTSPPRVSVADAESVPLASAHLKDATVTLPRGLTVNPSVANGLAACSEQQIGYQPSGGQIHFSKAPQSCPNAAKIGTMEVKTPLLDHKLPGAVYLAKPYDNPFGSFMALYLAVEDEQTGIVAKLAGKVTSDPQSGQLTTTFTENPQLPLEDIELHLFNGPKAALKTPLTCGRYTTTSTIVPWSTPEGETTHPSDEFLTSVAPTGGACPQSESQAPNKPSFSAGTISPQAGAYSPFVLKVVRQDGSQRIRQIDATMPKGLTGKLAGIPYCSDAAIAQAISREAPNQGVVEQNNPSCPVASEVGTATVGAGAGVTPYYTTGHAYLAGPYKGAPLSLAIITPAVAGPFDLGAVVVRTPLYVNTETAQIHAVSDPIPSIIQGIPLDIRSIAVNLSKPDFTLNPTSCDPTQVLGSTTSTLGSVASLANPFQVGGCKSLKFAPKLALSLKGGTARGKHPALKAVLTYPKGANYANTASAQVTLPHGEFLDNAHFKTICTKVQFNEGTCPKGSIYGYAKAFTPLLDEPVQGPVYLRSSSHELPDLVAALSGQVNVVLAGRVDVGKNKGLRNTFEATPDAPVSKFVLEMQGGKKGLLVNSENICRKEQRAIAAFTGQNGKVSETKPLVKNDCKGKPKKKAKKAHKGGKGHGGKR